MRRHLIPASLAAACLAAAMLAAPAGAQIAGSGSSGPLGGIAGPSIGSQLADIERRAARARKEGNLSRREERRIDREAERIADRGRIYAHGGLSDSELRELEARTNYLRDAVTAQATTKPRPAVRRRGR
jgi:hypothetical protein